METTIKLNIEDYLTHDEIKDIMKDQVRNEVRTFFKDEKNAQRLLSNLSYQIVFNEIDKIIPNSKELIIKQTEKVIRESSTYNVFRDGSYGSSKSLASTYVEDAVKANKELINQKVKDTIISTDYSQSIWNKFEALAETFISNIYSITDLGREKLKKEQEEKTKSPF